MAKSTSDQATIRLGTRVVHETSEIAAYSAHAGLTLDLFDTAQSVRASFAGGGYDFDVSGASSSKVGVTAGGSYDLLTDQGFDLSVRYDVELQDTSAKHALGMNIRVEF